MKYYFAPMEGVAGYIYRNAHHKLFGTMDKYFTPFIVPNQNKTLSSRELNDILPEHNQGMNVIPQILTNHAEGFLWTANKLKALGYQEINLNLGCPSGTVVSKKRGAGFLAYREELARFLGTVFAGTDRDISIKTRIGKESPDEFYELIQIFNKYPLKELIIHPRIQTDFYKNKPNLQVFGDAVKLSSSPVCYNGDLFTAGAYQEFSAAFPQIKAVMLGRGLIANPGLADRIRTQTAFHKQKLREFHDLVYIQYQETIPGGRNALFKMKELWCYMICLFPDSEKYAKKIKKAERLGDYEAAVADLFRERELVEGAGFLS